MNKKIIYIFVLSLILSNLSVGKVVFGADKSADEFYSLLPESEYKEYTDAKINVREKTLGKNINEASKGLGKYSFGDLAEYPDNEIYYFFASAIEDKNMIIKKFAVYNVSGKRIETGMHRVAKKEAVMKDGFNGWETPLDDNELSNKRD